MIVNKLYLDNFRNYENQTIEFTDGINIIYGNNAQGKTNLVEALYFSSIGKSFKAGKEKDLIKFSSPSAKIRVDILKNVGRVQIETNLFADRKKQIKVNGAYLTKIADLYGNLVTVFFCPNDLKLVKEAPGDRRKFLDVAISQLSRKYFNLLIKYQQILENRNTLLKNKISKEELKLQIEVWDKYLSEIGADIISQRQKFVEILNEYAHKVHNYLTGNNEELSVIYQGQTTELQNISEQLYTRLKENFEKDLQAGYTQTGPHRDDLKLIVNGMDIRTYGSQGQQRSVALSLKLAEKEILKEKIGEYPVLILDDVFSELDTGRTERLIRLLQKGQTFITTTEEINVGKIIKISNGKVIKE